MTEETSPTRVISGGPAAWRHDAFGSEGCPSCAGPGGRSSVSLGHYRAAAPMAPRELGSMAWALAPLVTVGMAAGPCFVYAALRRRSRASGLAALAYGLVTAALVWGNLWSPGSAPEVNVGVLAVLTLWSVSSVHALAVRRSVFLARSSKTPSSQRRSGSGGATSRLRIAVTDPRLARELRIGRPTNRPTTTTGAWWT